MVHFKMYLWCHIVDCSHESFTVLIQVRRKNKVCNLEVEVVFLVYKEIFRLQVPVCKT